MIKVISVRFRMAGKVYFFDPCDLDIKKGMHVIVETTRGIEYGLVVSDIREMPEEKVIQPLKPVLRIATPEDDAQDAENLKKKDEAFKICQEKIAKHELDMKLVDVEYTFDNNKILFYFTADGRIDFRELVKDLAAIFKTRIELRQIGVRDEIKILGGIGVCGRVLCCHSYLSEFVPVSIKMAKEQNLSLNPTKISGVCGRLMCCLKNEEETYEDLNRRLPNVGDYVTADDGLRGEVHSVNVLRQRVKVIVDMGDEKEIKEYQADQLQFKKMFHKDKSDLSAEEMKQLELLEKQEQEDKLLKEERKSERNARNNEGGRNDRDKNNGNDRADRGEKADRNNRNDGGEKNEKPQNNSGNNKNERFDKNQNSNRNKEHHNNHNNKGNNSNNANNSRNEGFPKNDKGAKDAHNSRNEQNASTGNNGNADKVIQNGNNGNVDKAAQNGNHESFHKRNRHRNRNRKHGNGAGGERNNTNEG